MGGGVPIVANQTLDFGRLTLTGAGGTAVVNTGNTITSASIDSGTDADHWAVSSNGTFTPSATGISEGLSASYSLGCTFTNASGSDGATITINTEAATYSVIPGEIAAALTAIGTASSAARTIKCRPGTYSSGLGSTVLNDKAFVNRVTITAHNQSSKPLFTGQILDIKNTDNLTLSYLELYHATLGDTDGLIEMRNGSDNIIIDNCLIYGVFKDPYYASPYVVDTEAPLGRGILLSNTCGTITITNNVIHSIAQGFVMVQACTGDLLIQGNEIYWFFQDGMYLRALDTSDQPASVIIRDHISHDAMINDLDFFPDGPHVDHIQFDNVGTVGETWDNVTVERVRIWEGTARGVEQAQQGIFCRGNPGSNGAQWNGMRVAGCIISLGAIVWGIGILHAKDCRIYGNTVCRPISGGGTTSVLGIRIGSEGSSGTHIIKNCVTEAIDSAGVTVGGTNCKVLGLRGATIPYSDCFDLIAGENPESAAEMLTHFNMLALGELDVDNSGTASVGDIGAAGSGYVNWVAKTIDTGYE